MAAMMLHRVALRRLIRSTRQVGWSRAPDSTLCTSAYRAVHGTHPLLFARALDFGSRVVF